MIASVETSTAEATEALKGITIVTPGRENAARSATDGKKKDGKKKSSGSAEEKRKMKLQKKHKAKILKNHINTIDNK